MERRYFSEDAYNRISCAVVAFKEETLEIVFANERYYADFANGNFEKINVYKHDEKLLLGLKERINDTNSLDVNYKYNINGEICRATMSVNRYSNGVLLAVIKDASEQHKRIAQLKNEIETYEMALCSSSNTAFENNIKDDSLILYIPSLKLNKVEKKYINNQCEYLEKNVIHPNDKKFFFENIYNDKEEILSARMKLPNDESWKWYRVHRKFDYNSEKELVKVFGVIRNIEDERQHENELKSKMEMDSVLKVYNRNAAVDKINTYLYENSDRRDFALLIIDIDDFKYVNDTYGHLYGDAVIEKAAEILNSSTDDKAFIGRYGGDEFFIFLKEIENDKVKAIAEDIIKKMENVYVADDKCITCSIGIAVGELFDSCPDYKDIFEKADKALYRVKNNGKAHWEIYEDNTLYKSAGHAVEYETENDNEELLKTRDIMKVFLELSAGSKNSDATIYKIMKHLMDRFSIDWMQIMKVNCKEDNIEIKYEMCSDPDFRNNSGRSGYYVHADMQRLRDGFEKHPIFVPDDKNTVGFSMKFRREFEKSREKGAVVYNANVTKDDTFYMFVSNRFNRENNWGIEEVEEFNFVTKLMTMYVANADKETDNERKLKHQLDYDRKTGLYSISKFYEQIGRLRKLALENDQRIAVIHSDFHNFFEFNKNFGQMAGDDLLISFAELISKNDESDRHIATHLDGTDIFFSAYRIENDFDEIVDTVVKTNNLFCDMYNEKYKGANLIIKSGIYIFKRNEEIGDGLDKALSAKKNVKDYTKSYCAVYKNQLK